MSGVETPDLDYPRKPLDAIFAPKSVAVIGASERPGSVGRTIVANLIASPFGGVVYPVSLKRKSILGIRAYPTLEAVPDAVDLAVIVTPASTVPAIMEECVQKGVRGVIIISAGFKEIGPEGAALEQEVMRIAKKGKIRVVGPNCLGVMNPQNGLNATFAATMAMPGNVGFISQSGALCTSVLDWSLRENVGFSAFVSIGSMLDIGWGDLIYYLGNDARTKSIVIYMESIGDARAFMSAAREVALTKPIIVIKPGRTAEAAEAAASHTGSLTGSDEVLDAAFRRCGVLRVNRIAELFDMAEVLGKQPRPKGPRLTIVTNAGGPGVLATDALIYGGGELAQLAPETMEKLNEFLPGHWSHHNPIDILGDAGPERYAATLDTIVEDSNSDGLLVILTPQAMTDPAATAKQMLECCGRSRKPILASWMGGGDIAEGEQLLNRAGIPTFLYPDTAARMFNYMHRYQRRLNSLYETPQVVFNENAAEVREEVRRQLGAIRATGRTILTEKESKDLLKLYGIPVLQTEVATKADDAVALAEEMGYPVVVKLHSKTITHKTDVGGVQLNLNDEAEVREAFATIKKNVEKRFSKKDFLGVSVQRMLDLSESYEIILGSSLDSQFGPVLLFGTGGTMVEVYKDRALGLPPLTTTLARRMMEQTRIYEALQGIRGRNPVDLARLEQIMAQFSELVIDQRQIKEIDINPLLASADHLIAVDARIVLHGPEVASNALPRSAIHRYPVQYIEPYTLKDGTEVNIRPIRPEDEPMMIDFHEGLSDHSVYLRFFRSLNLSQRVAHERLMRLCFIDYDREMALVATHLNKETGKREIIGVGRLSRDPNIPESEFALLVTDKYQRSGLGTELLRRLIRIGHEQGLETITAYLLPNNNGMRAVSLKLGFSLEFEDGLIHARLPLEQEALT
ncbi:MAG: bifunctional acetate--CoA ligase family protein/GNAT family N-acetyltransferase [Anaerolineales bacterium]|nr:bifunctional acetate--CoA ligase family protein/GNAT family N-acetyltransferase [Anaerolineales bacterium]